MKLSKGKFSVVFLFMFLCACSLSGTHTQTFGIPFIHKITDMRGRSSKEF